MTRKFLQALSQLKSTSLEEVRAQRRERDTPQHGAVAFQADVYRRRRAGTIVTFSKPRTAEH